MVIHIKPLLEYFTFLHCLQNVVCISRLQHTRVKAASFQRLGSHMWLVLVVQPSSEELLKGGLPPAA